MLCGVYARREATYGNIDHARKVFDMALLSVEALPVVCIVLLLKCHFLFPERVSLLTLFVWQFETSAPLWFHDPLNRISLSSFSFCRLFSVRLGFRDPFRFSLSNFSIFFLRKKRYLKCGCLLLNFVWLEGKRQ